MPGWLPLRLWGGEEGRAGAWGGVWWWWGWVEPGASSTQAKVLPLSCTPAPGLVLVLTEEASETAETHGLSTRWRAVSAGVTSGESLPHTHAGFWAGEMECGRAACSLVGQR